MEKSLLNVLPQGGYALILNPMCITADLPIELVPGSMLSRPTSLQLDKIKATLDRLTSFTMSYMTPSIMYESETIVIKTQTGSTLHREQLLESEWRYYIVSTPDNGITNINIQYASNISEIPLELSGVTFFAGGYGTRPQIVLNTLCSPLPKNAPRVDRTTLEDVSSAYSDLMAIGAGIGTSADYPAISEAVQMFDSLKLLNANSQFQVIGLFAIIELLITHNPKLEDRGDSIGHQMRSKIPLLARRFVQPLGYTDYYQEESEEKIWNALYNYRSIIAHGGMPNFKSKELKILKDADTAGNFLRVAVRALIRHSLKEPLLYRDIKKC